MGEYESPPDSAGFFVFAVVIAWHDTPEKLWFEHRLLLIAFIIASLAAILFAVRLMIFTIYWSQHRDEPLQGWMTIGYVARSYDLPREALAVELGLVEGATPRISLSGIAKLRGVPLASVEERVLAFIATSRPDADTRSGKP